MWLEVHMLPPPPPPALPHLSPTTTNIYFFLRLAREYSLGCKILEPEPFTCVEKYVDLFPTFWLGGGPLCEELLDISLTRFDATIFYQFNMFTFLEIIPRCRSSTKNRLHVTSIMHCLHMYVLRAQVLCLYIDHQKTITYYKILHRSRSWMKVTLSLDHEANQLVPILIQWLPVFICRASNMLLNEHHNARKLRRSLGLDPQGLLSSVIGWKCLKGWFAFSVF